MDITVGYRLYFVIGLGHEFGADRFRMQSAQHDRRDSNG